MPAEAAPGNGAQIRFPTIIAFYALEADPDWLERTRFSLPEELMLMVVLGPLFEELLFRGALFSALMRRWGIWVAAIVPSVLWGLHHFPYEWWFVASIAGSGVVLAIIRWKSESLYLPLGLHAAFNLVVALTDHFLPAATA